MAGVLSHLARLIGGPLLLAFGAAMVTVFVLVMTTALLATVAFVSVGAAALLAAVLMLLSVRRENNAYGDR